MKNPLLTLILFTLLAAGCRSVEATPEYACRADAIAAQINNPNSDYVVVACHRGDWRNFPENSLPAIESVIAMGADIVEIDVKMTKDSVLILSHDQSLTRCTNFKGVFGKDKSPLVSDLNYDEICRLRMKRGHGITTDTLHIPTLRQALELCRDRICVNIDHAQNYYDEVLAIAAELGVTHQILMKDSRPLEVIEAERAKYSRNTMYMPIVNVQTPRGQQLLQSYLDSGVTPLAYEVCWGSEGDGVYGKACEDILSQGSKIWVNTIWATLCGGLGHDDDAAFASDDPAKVYDRYLDRGVSMIQTDRPSTLIPYLERKGRHTLPKGPNFPGIGPGGRTAIVAHRGFWKCEEGGMSENSIASLRAAQNAGLWGSECDVHLTADGVVIVNHNGDIEGKLIADHLYADFAQDLLPNGERRPTLEEYALQASRSRTTMLVIELKKQPSPLEENMLVDKTIETLSKIGMLDPQRVAFISFSYGMCRRIARLCPGFINQYINGDKTPRELMVAGINGMDYNHRLLCGHCEWISDCNASGMSSNSWTVNDSSSVRILSEAGIGALTTNEPLMVRNLLGKKELKH